MPREINRLNARSVATIKEAGRHADGLGLYLSISENGGRRWVFLYRRQGKLREKGLGSARTVSLKTARDLAQKARDDLTNGRDPLAARQQDDAPLTFAECATAYMDAHRASWRNPIHAKQWETTLATYAYPIIGQLPVSDVSTDHVLEILKPIWNDKTETASRLRGRIETILDRARALGQRSEENPARWRGHLDHLLPRYSKVKRTRHHPALPYPEISAFIASLQGREGIASLAMEFLILTAARTSEVAGAEVQEIDRPNKVWTIPAERMKSGIEHRVPLSSQALAVLARAQEQRNPKSRFLFPSYGGSQLSPNALLALLHRMGRDDLTTHGFRSTFRDWAAETTNFPNQVVEMALAHVIRDKVEAAYRRGDLFAKRAALMTAWANYCFAERGTVLSMSAVSDANQ